jgi:hypothetical protein
MYLLVFHTYINECTVQEAKSSVKISSIYSIYDVKFLNLLGAPYIYDSIRLRVTCKVNGGKLLCNCNQVCSNTY